MEIKASNFLNQRFIDAYRSLAEKDNLGISTMSVIKVIKKLSEEHEVFEKTRLSIFKKYGTLEGEQYVVKASNLDEKQFEDFTKEINDLHESNINIPIDSKIKISYKCGLKPVEFILLDEFIEASE